MRKPKPIIRNALGAVSPFPVEMKSLQDMASMAGLPSTAGAEGGVGVDTKKHVVFAAVPEGESEFDFAVRQHEAAHLYVAKRVSPEKYDEYIRWINKHYDNLTAQIVMDIICNKYIPNRCCRQLIEHDTILKEPIKEHKVGYALARANAMRFYLDGGGLTYERPITHGWLRSIEETAKKLCEKPFGSRAQRRAINDLYHLCNPPPPPKDSPIPSGEPPGITDTEGRWPPRYELTFEEGKLVDKRATTTFETIPSYSGQFRYASRFYTDARMWQRRVEVNGNPNLSFVVDYSGSMALLPEHIEGMLEHVHGEVWIYAHQTCKRIMGQGYRTDCDTKRWSANNYMDYNALEFVHQRNPHHKIVYISDMVVGGYGGGYTPSHHNDVRDFCIKHNIDVYPTIEAALEDYGV